MSKIGLFLGSTTGKTEYVACLDYESTTPIKGCSKRCQQSEWSIATN